MLEVKGFVEIPSFINNTQDATAAVGELSVRSRTYAKDRQRYEDPAKDASQLVIFHCEDSGSKQLFPSTLKDLCLDIMESAFGTFITSKTFQEQLEDAFPALTNIQTGLDLVHSGRAMTEWFSFDYIEGGLPISIKLWLSNSSFAAEYDEYQTIVIAPTLSLEDYHDTLEKATLARDGFTTSIRFGEQSAAIGNNPPTDMRIVTLNWENPSNSAETIVTEWTIIGYGEQAFVNENMLEAIRLYLVDNSSHDLASWVTHFPELDNIDVIHIFPQWNNVSLTTSSTPGGEVNLYATYARYDVGIDNLRKILTGTTLTTMKKYVDVISSIYKSITIFIVGNDRNSVGKQRFSDIFPKYAVLNINDINLGRLPADVQAFITLLNQLLVQAEIDDGTSILPVNMVRQSTAGANFIETVSNGVTYRVCTKDTYLPFT